MQDGYTDADNNPLYPAAIVWVGSFFLAEAISTVFECTIDTIFLCSFKDAAEYDGKYMSKEMKDAFGMEGETAEKESGGAIQSAPPLGPQLPPAHELCPPPPPSRASHRAPPPSQPPRTPRSTWRLRAQGRGATRRSQLATRRSAPDCTTHAVACGLGL